MGREVGEGFRMGNTCTPIVDSCLCMAKPIQHCKVKTNKQTNKTKTMCRSTVCSRNSMVMSTEFWILVLFLTVQSQLYVNIKSPFRQTQVQNLEHPVLHSNFKLLNNIFIDLIYNFNGSFLFVFVLLFLFNCSSLGRHS